MATSSATWVALVALASARLTSGGIVEDVLAAELVDEAAICGAGNQTCESAVSLRQLRREVLRATLETIATSEDIQITISCKATHHYCMDYMTYRSQGDCSEDKLCQMKDVSEVGGVRGEAWLCAPAHERCAKKFKPEDFQNASLAPLVEFAANEAEKEEEDELDDEEEEMDDEDDDRTVEELLSGNGGLHTEVARGRPQHHWHKPPLAPEGNGSFHGSSNISGTIMTLYHTTSKGIAEKIMENGFRAGHGGWCGGAIYFLNHPHLPKGKYNPRTTKGGAILQAQVRVGNMAHMTDRCKLKHWHHRHGWGVYAARSQGYNSVTFNPHDGDEYVIWDMQQVLSVKIFQYMW